MNSILNNNQNNPSILMNQEAMTQSFKEFASNWTPEGAKKQIEQMLNSGQISQQQFEQAKQIASSILMK